MSLSYLPLIVHALDGSTTLPNPVIYKFDGSHRFLSNFWPCHVTLPAEGDLPAQDFATVENAYVAWKTLDATTREKIAVLSPGAAKNLSKQPDFLVRPDFTSDTRVVIMADLVAQKFSTANPKLLEQFLATKDMLLIEGNDWGDSFFGFDLVNGHGDNHLGRILMDVRRQRLAEQNRL